MSSETPRERLATLLQQAENGACADCSEPEPTWASTNCGVFICTQCAGVHRSLGVENSFVLSCTLDEWTHTQVDNMAANGNTRVNQLLEYSVPKIIEVPCLSYTDRDTREKFIRAKYVERLFQATEGKSPRPPDRVPRRGTNNSMCSIHSAAAMVEFIGIININMTEGRNLIIKDLVTSDPYCVLKLGLQTFKTKTQYRTLSPVWREHFAFSWNGVDELRVDLYDRDKLTEDDHMGCLTFDLSPLLREAGALISGWFPVLHRKHSDRTQGEVCLDISFMRIE